MEVLTEFRLWSPRVRAAVKKLEPVVVAVAVAVVLAMAVAVVVVVV